jgi:hypothetical protein
MKAYVLTTGTISGIIALLHVVHAIIEWSMLKSAPGQYFFELALGLFAAALTGWAWWLLLRTRSAAAKSLPPEESVR